jgi:hypothetical protein
MRNKHKNKFLTESILFEESGLPKINVILSLFIFILLVLFILWANRLTVQETLSVSGALEETSSSYMIQARVLSREIAQVDEDATAFVSILGVTSRKPLVGYVSEINTLNKTSSSGLTYYDVYISVDDFGVYEEDLLKGMDCSVKVVTDEKSLLAYLLGNLYDSARTAFNVK